MIKKNASAGFVLINILWPNIKTRFKPKANFCQYLSKKNYTTKRTYRNMFLKVVVRLPFLCFDLKPETFIFKTHLLFN